MEMEYRRDYPSQRAMISLIAMKCGMKTETLRAWVRKADVDSGRRAVRMLAVIDKFTRECLLISDRFDPCLGSHANKLKRPCQVIGSFRVTVTNWS